MRRYPSYPKKREKLYARLIWKAGPIRRLLKRWGSVCKPYAIRRVVLCRFCVDVSIKIVLNSWLVEHLSPFFFHHNFFFSIWYKSRFVLYEQIYKHEQDRWRSTARTYWL